MILREYTKTDSSELAELFYDTVHTVNARDYLQEQLDAWATGAVNLEEWDKSFLSHHTVVAELGGNIVGFGDMDETGYLDRLYVHRDYQRRGWQRQFVMHWSNTPKPQNLPPTHPSRQDRSLKNGDTPLPGSGRWSAGVFGLQTS